MKELKTKEMLKKIVALLVLSITISTWGFLPPVEERCGIKVEIESFPQKIERPQGVVPSQWPLGVTEVKAGSPRTFPVTLENKTTASVTGTLEVWMNDDWSVAGEAGELTLNPGEKKILNFTGVAKERALSALYPVHARFTPTGVKKEDAPHPIAIFMYQNPNAPRPVTKAEPLTLERGVFKLDVGFARTSAVEVKGEVHALPESGAAKEWGGGMEKKRLTAGGISKNGFFSHPPFIKGIGFVWSDFPLDLPDEKPITFSCSNFLVSNYSAPPSDGVEYKVFVLEEGKEPKEICAQTVKKILTWQEMMGDLTPWAGRKITLRLWTGPGPDMNATCDGGGWGDLRLVIGLQRETLTEDDWKKRTRAAVKAACGALKSGTNAAKGCWLLEAGDGVRYGAGVVPGARGLIDGALAFTDGKRSVVYRGFTVDVLTENGSAAPDAEAEIRAEKGTLRIKWTLPGVTRNERGFPRIGKIAVGPSSEDIERVYAGFGVVIEKPIKFNLIANGFYLSTRHVGVDYANGISIVQATDVPPDALECDAAARHFALVAHHDALFTFAPSTKSAFAAARAFRAVSGYRKSPGLGRLGSRMCIDIWGGDYNTEAKGLALLAKYGLANLVVVKHMWQCWGYDYRLPEIYPPKGDVAAFNRMREVCRSAGMLFCPHDNYTDIYPDAENFSYDLTVFDLDGTPKKAWFNPTLHALSYKWAPHAFSPWCQRNAKLLKAGFDPDGIFIDVLTAGTLFDYLDRDGKFHTKMETSAYWGKAFDIYRQAFGRADTVCISEAGQDHLIGVADAGQSNHFDAKMLVGRGNFADAERTPWHDIVTHNYYVLLSGGLGGHYHIEDGRRDYELHGYASDDYLSNCMLGGRNPMCDGPFNRNAVKTYYLQHDACAELVAAEFLDLKYEGSIHRQHSVFSDGGEVWVNRATNGVWKLPNGIVLPSYGYYAKTRGTVSGVIEKDGVRCSFARSNKTAFFDARKPPLGNKKESDERDRLIGINRAGVMVEFEGVKTDGSFRLDFSDANVWTLTPLPSSTPFGARIDLDCFGAAGRKVVAVEAIEPAKDAKAVAWKQKDNALGFKADAKAFAYRIKFDL